MDMKKILESMDAAAVGNKPFKGDPNFNDMKSILESLQKVQTSEAPKQKLNESATMSINMTADNASQVGELMALMRNAGMDPKPVSADMPMPAPNASKFAQAAMDDPNIPGRDEIPGDQDLQAGAIGGAIGGGLGGALGPLGAAAGGGLGSGKGGAIGGALGSLAGGPLGGAIGGALGGALLDKDVDDPNIPGDDDVAGDQDLQAGQGGALAGGLAGGAAGHVLGKGVGAALGGLGRAAGTAIGGPVGGEIGAAIGQGVPALAGSVVGSKIGDKLTGEDQEELNSIRRLSGIEEVVVGGDAKPEDPDSVYARLMGDISEIQNGAMEGDDMADFIADELGDYLRNGDAPEDSHYAEAIGIIQDALHDGPEAQAEAAEEAISVLHSAEEEARGNNEDYENEPGEEYAPYSDMTRGGTDLNKSKKTYPKVAGGDNPMALKNKIKEELTALYNQYKQNT